MLGVISEIVGNSFLIPSQNSFNNKKLVIKNTIICVCVCLYVYMPHMCKFWMKSEGIRVPGVGVTDVVLPDLGHLKEQQVLLITGHLSNLQNMY